MMRQARLGTLFTDLSVFPLMKARIHSGHRSPCIKSDLLQVHAAMLCTDHSNCLTVQSNQNPRFRTERARKGLTERENKMPIEFDASHIRESYVPTIRLARSFIADFLSSEK